MRARMDQLAAMVESLQDELTTLRRQAVEPASDVQPGDASASGSRRHLLKLAGGAAVAAAAGGALLGGARPAAADTNQALVVGRWNFAQNITYMRNASGTNGSLATDPLTTERLMFWVDNRLSTLPTAIGVRGDGRESGTGVDGYGGTGVTGTGSGVGVLGSGPVGVSGNGIGATGVGLGASGPRAALLLVANTGTAPLLRTNAHAAGEVDLDTDGNVWLCVAGGSPGQWRKIGGPATAGALHAIDPVRAYDSRWSGNTRLVTGANRVVSVADAHNSAGVVIAPDIVPAGTTAIAYNITVTETTGSGFLSVAPGAATSSTASSINWSGDGQNLANGLIVALDDSRQVKVFCGGGGTTQFVVDVTGYFR